MPSRNDALGAALAGTIGGPVGRHAMIGRSRFWTPLRVMLLIGVVFLALGYSTKAACLQSLHRAVEAGLAVETSPGHFATAPGPSADLSDFGPDQSTE